MMGMIIQKLTSVLYKHPVVREDIASRGQFGRLKVALVTDYFTTACLGAECRIRSMTPQNYQEVITCWKPDLVFVESVFHGMGGAWRYKVAKQSKVMRLSKPVSICRLVQFARDRGIPTVFWNKDDGAFFDTFIDVAKLFEHVFTTDINCLSRYQAALPEGGKAHVLIMPYQPAFHSFTGFHFERNEGCFVGSYYQRILNQRREFLDMLFGACKDANVRMNIYDRNSSRFSRYFEFKFPQGEQLKVRSSIPYTETSRVYKAHAVSLNVNSVTDSETMCSRRLLEILACGGIAVTNPSPAVDKLFSDYCHVVETMEQARELLARLKFGPSAEDKDRAEAGALYVRSAHTWERRLEQINDTVNF